MLVINIGHWIWRNVIGNTEKSRWNIFSFQTDLVNNFNHVGNKFWRVRIGVGHPGEKKRVKKHVLNNFAKSDQKWVKETLAAISKAIPILLRGNDSAFMTKIALLQQLAKGKHQKPKENRITVLQKDK